MHCRRYRTKMHRVAVGMEYDSMDKNTVRGRTVFIRRCCSPTESFDKSICDTDFEEFKVNSLSNLLPDSDSLTVRNTIAHDTNVSAGPRLHNEYILQLSITKLNMMTITFAILMKNNSRRPSGSTTSRKR